MLFLLLGLASAGGLSDRAYERAIDLVDGLYLYPDELDATALLRASAEQLAREIHWLIVEEQGSAVNLRHGDGTLIGSVSVANLETLPVALEALETLIEGTGYPTDEVDLRLAALEGLTRGLDRYSRVLSGDGLDRFDVRLKGTLVGIGIRLVIADDRLQVSRVNPGGPADLAGLEDGDVLLRIDGRSTVNMPTREANRRIRGREGSPVTLQVQRDGKALEIAVTRAQVVVPNVESRVLEGGVAWVGISHMSQRTVENLLGELEKLEARGALDHGLVLDLRQNTGGSMKESARTVDEFVDHGLLLRTAGHDGGQVRNLQARMDAEPGGRVPDVPVAILVDERTASGAEILAGALLELDRAVLIGTRTYGKGTVQKIYPLGDDVRLKLTVARYILENDRRIAEGGLVPDAAIGSITLDGYGVHYAGWSDAGVPRSDILPWVRERWSWRQQDVPEVDLAEELARRAVASAHGPTRKALLASLREQAERLEQEQSARIAEAFAAEGIDWSPHEGPVGEVPRVRATVKVEPDPDHDDVLVVSGEAVNLSLTEPLHRVSLEMASAFSGWDGLAIPIGRLEPGATLTGEVRVPLRRGIQPREDEVDLALRSDAHGRIPAGTATLRAGSRPVPRLAAVLSLVGEGPSRRAVVQLENLGDEDLEGVEVHFGWPGDADVELVDRASRVPVLPAKSTRRFELEVTLGEQAPGPLPLRLEVESPSHGRMARWPVSLPLSGDPVRIEPPSIEAIAHPPSQPAMAASFPVLVRDDGTIDHVVVYHNGAKAAWSAGAEQQVALAAKLELDSGTNRITVVAEDQQGLRTVEHFIVRGLPTDGVVSP